MHTLTLRPRTALAVMTASILAAGTLMPLPAALAQSAGQAASSRDARVEPTVISADGSATVSRAPDLAEVSIGVQASGKTTSEATDALNRAMERVIKAVKDTQLAGLVVQSQNVSLYPEYERQSDGRQTREPKIIGYRASNTIRVTTSDVANVGQVLDKGIAAGANQVFGISFSRKDDAEARREALVKATADAKSKAEAIAGALGYRIVRVQRAQTGSLGVRPMYKSFGRGEWAAADAGFAAAPTPIESGQVEVSAQVSIEFIVEPN